ncbi:MAG: hypothetical protein ABSD57_10945 [Verrucomicrobiota bacterium]|jgi:hypothetical protein
MQMLVQPDFRLAYEWGISEGGAGKTGVAAFGRKPHSSISQDLRRSAETPLWQPNPLKKPVATPRFSGIFILPFHPVNRRLNRANGPHSHRVDAGLLCQSKAQAGGPQQHQTSIPCSAGCREM